LRRKLVTVGAPANLIKTVHGVGYRLNPLYGSPMVVPVEHTPTLSQTAELKAVNQALRYFLEQLQSTQAELEEKNQALQVARHHLEERLGEGAAVIRATNQLLQQQL
jgi:hypothetical protein